MSDKQYHETELAKYRRILKTCESHQHTGIMNWIAYHSIKVDELTNDNNGSN